jgi:hypothetical protein
MENTKLLYKWTERNLFSFGTERVSFGGGPLRYITRFGVHGVRPPTVMSCYVTLRYGTPPAATVPAVLSSLTSTSVASWLTQRHCDSSVYFGNCTDFWPTVTSMDSGFGGLVVSMLASGIQFRGFKPGRSRRIFRDEKIPSKAVCPTSRIYGMLKNHTITVEVAILCYIGRTIVPSFAGRGLSRHLTWSAPGDERGETKSGVSTISLGRLQYIRWVTAGRARKTKIRGPEFYLGSW